MSKDSANNMDADNPYAFPIPDESPFPPKSDFAKLFAILYEYRDIGISRADLALCYRKWTSKDINEADYDVANFLSAMMKGISHSPIWITEKNGVIKMHLEPRETGNTDDDSNTQRQFARR